MNDVNVFNVIRKGADALHFVTEEIPIETTVKQEIDWSRRLDHMQQHSGKISVRRRTGATNQASNISDPKTNNCST